MAAVADVRQAEARHPHEAVHVRLEDGALVLLGRLVERRTTECETGVVDEDVDAAELLHRRCDEARATLGIGDVQLECHFGLEPFDAPSPARNANPRLGEHPRCRPTEARRGAGDDRGLTGQVHGARC